MTKEEILSILAECGIEENKAVARALLNAFNEEKRNAIVENTNKIMEDLKDWKSPEDVKKLQEQIDSMKAEGKKAQRTQVLKDAKVDEEYYDFLESKFGDSKDFKSDVEEYLKAHKSFVKSETKQSEEVKQETPKTEETKEIVKEETQNVSFNVGGTSQNAKKQPVDMRDAIADYYKDQVGQNKTQ